MLPPAACLALMVNTNVHPAPVRLMRDIHLRAHSETAVELKSGQAPVHTTSSVVELRIHTSDDESTDPLPSVWEHGIVVRTAWT